MPPLNRANIHRVKIPRTPLAGMPDVAILAGEQQVKNDPDYAAAKAGDAMAAGRLIGRFINSRAIEQVEALVGGAKPILLPVHALEISGINEIPVALAERLATELDLDIDDSIVQDNTVGHTGASGYQRLANPALFSGEVKAGAGYLIVDDFIGQGGTVANLKGFLEANGGSVIGVTTLTGRPYSAKLAPEPSLIQAVRDKHGNDLETWWQQEFGYGFDCLTQSEARYLERSPDADTIRKRVVEARQSAVDQTAERPSQSGLTAQEL